MINANVSQKPDLTKVKLETIVSAADARAAAAVGITTLQQAYDALVATISAEAGNADLSRRGIDHDPSNRIEAALMAYPHIPDDVKSKFVIGASDNPELTPAVKAGLRKNLSEFWAGLTGA